MTKCGIFKDMAAKVKTNAQTTLILTVDQVLDSIITFRIRKIMLKLRTLQEIRRDKK